MHEQDRKHYQKLREAYVVLYSDLVRMSYEIHANLKAMSDEEMADLIYVAKECEKIANVLRKSYKNVRIRAEKTFCVMKVQKNDVEPTRTEFCTVSPDLKVVTHVPSPKEHPDEYDALLAELGVPPEVRKYLPLTPRWGGLVEYCSALAAEGKPLPRASEKKTYNVYGTRCTRKKHILADMDSITEDKPDLDETPIADEEYLPPRYTTLCIFCDSPEHASSACPNISKPASEESPSPRGEDLF